MPEFKTHGIVLRTRDYREADKLVTLFTREEGKVTAVARGVRKTSSKLAALVEPLTLAYFLLHRGRNLETLIQGEIIKPYRTLHADLILLAYAHYFCELCDASLPEREPSVQIFSWLLAALEALETDSNPARVARCFELSLLDALGFRPALDSCQHCGDKAGPFRFDLSQGGLVCQNCPANHESIVVSGAAVSVMKRFLKYGFHRLSVCSVPEVLAGEIERLNHALFASNLGKSGFKTYSVLQSIIHY